MNEAEVGALRTSNIYTGDTYYMYNYVMICLRLSMSVLLTMFRHSMYLTFLPLSIFRGSRCELRGGQEEAERIPQKFIK